MVRDRRVIRGRRKVRGRWRFRGTLLDGSVRGRIILDPACVVSISGISSNLSGLLGARSASLDQLRGFLALRCDGTTSFLRDGRVVCRQRYE